MTASLLVALAAAVAPPPSAITITTPRGEMRIAVDRGPEGEPGVPARMVFSSLGATVVQTGPWVEVTLAGVRFQFLEGTPYYRVGEDALALATNVYRSRDTLFVPLQFVAEVLPARFQQRYHYDARRAAFFEIGGGDPMQGVALLPNGLRPGHLVTIDPGHGGNDPGTAGRYFPKGVREKDVTLQIGLKLRDELKQRGVGVTMTRTTDVRPPLLERAPMCSEGCDLFVSLHVDAMPASRSNYRSVRGFHTFIIGEENSADAARVARMENDALRYEVQEGGVASSSALEFIFKDLQMNEFLHESANAAASIQAHLAKVHAGENKGVHQYNRWAVLNTAHRPAVLVEMGFRTNQHDAAFLSSDAGQRKIATALADAIVQYLKDYDRKTGATTISGAGR